MEKEKSIIEMNLDDEVGKILTRIGEPTFILLSPTPVSDAKGSNTQSVSILPSPTVDYADVERRKEESKKHMGSRKLENTKKGKSIILEPGKQCLSVNNKRQKINVDELQSSKLKLMVKNIFPTPFEKSRLDLYGLFKDVVDNDELIGVDASTHLNDDDFTTPPPVPNKGKSKADPVPRDNNTNLLCEIKRISDGQKDLRENLQLDEDYRCRGLNIDHENEYHDNNINYDQNITIHLDNIQIMNEDPISGANDNMSSYPGPPTMVEIKDRRSNDGLSHEPSQIGPQLSHNGVLGACQLDNYFPQFQLQNSELSDTVNSKQYGTQLVPSDSGLPDIATHVISYIIHQNSVTSHVGYQFRDTSSKASVAFQSQQSELALAVLWGHEHRVAFRVLDSGRYTYGGQALEKSYLDVSFYYLRKKGMFDDVPVMFTTTDCLFDLKIKALYKNFIENNGDSDVVNTEHDIFKYILGEWLLCGSLCDRGIYVALFTECFIYGSDVFDNEFDVNNRRTKFG
ncbi:hypothetical protein FXO37_17541 [Capsicum annuum]|nr:hypothetical protein FXO37_17541 [Capsicum annuum]